VNYPAQVKVKAKAAWISGESLRAIARDMGIGLGTISRWSVGWRESGATRVCATRTKVPTPVPSSVPSNIIHFHKGPKKSEKGGSRPRPAPPTEHPTEHPAPVPSAPVPSAPLVRSRPSAPPVIGGVRPPLSQEIIGALVGELERACPREIAERVVGLPNGTVKAWLRHARRVLVRLEKSGDEPTDAQALELDLLSRLLYAESTVEADAAAQLQAIALRSDDDKVRLKATTELLARRFPSRWGDKREITLEGGKTSIKQLHGHVDLEAPSTEDMLARMNLAFAPTAVVEATLLEGEIDDE